MINTHSVLLKCILNKLILFIWWEEHQKQFYSLFQTYTLRRKGSSFNQCYVFGTLKRF